MKSLECKSIILSAVLGFLALGCVGPSPGPDKHGSGLVQGVAVGAGSGAITGAQFSSATGPGAVVGAGLGAVAGGVRGAVLDAQEEEQIRLNAELEYQRHRARAHQILKDHYEKRLEMHPTRDIFPADVFFAGDEVTLKDSAVDVVRELAFMNKERMPWSRLGVITYSKAADEESDYAKYLAESRSKEIANYLVQFGIEPRRIEAKAVILDAPLVLNDVDEYWRYGQAIEFVPLDR